MSAFIQHTSVLRTGVSMIRRLAFAGVAAIISVMGQANAAVVLTDDFSYPDGALVGNGGWTDQGGTPGTLLVSGGAVAISQDSGSQDAEVVFASDLTSGIITATFDISVADPGSGISGTGSQYFAHFSDDSAFNFRARTYVVAPVSTGDYSLGISTGSGGVENLLSVDFAFDEVVPVTLGFNLDTGVASLMAGGSSIVGAAPDLGETLDTFNLRQSNSSFDETIVFDNLVIDVTVIPEPSSLAILALGVSGLACRRRER
ncbi:MAG: PEP-CTERM sorting domain-containing protein [Planctomycetota bacterium]